MNNNIGKLILEVLEKGYLMSLGTQDDGGVWVCDVIYVHDDRLNVYWMSHPKTRHSNAVIKNPNIAGTITVNGPKDHNLGIQFCGIAKKIEGPRFDLVKKHYAKRNKPEPKETDDVLNEDAWYQLTPQKIELIHEQLFGFEKQRLEF